MLGLVALVVLLRLIVALRAFVIARIRSSLAIAMLVAAILFSAAHADAPQPPNVRRERRSLNAVCTKCHDLHIVTDTPMSYDAWHDTVQSMLDRGAAGTDDQLDDIMDYLHRTMTTINVNTADAIELQIVLNVPDIVAQQILARRRTQQFESVADLKSVCGIDASTVDAKARLIFFK